MDVVTLAGEAIEPLDEKNIIIQPTDGYRFGSDAVALAHYACAKLKRGARVFDLCSGCGIVGILVAIEIGAHVVGAEIDARLCDMSNRSAAADGLDAHFIKADIRDKNTLAAIGEKDFDAVVCNPPFFKADSKPAAVAPAANSELTVTLYEVLSAAKTLLKQNGELFMVYTATRLDEAVCACREAGLTPKDININRNGKTFLMRCVRGGKDGLNVVVGKF